MGSSNSKNTPQNGLIEKQAEEEQTQRQAAYDLHRYIEDPEDLEEMHLKEEDILISPEGGFRVELGGFNVDSINSPLLEEVDKHSLYYKNNFCNKVHFNYVSGNGANPIVISLVQLDKVKNQYRFSALLRTKKDDSVYNFTSKDRKSALKYLQSVSSELSGIGVGELVLVKNPHISDELQHMEDRILIKAYRIGVVYAGTSTDENEMFSNNHPSEGFKTFMKWLGQHIKLKGWKGFKGGLDVEHNTTGTHSYFTTAHGFDIMFHVSTELPFSDANAQQVERKRHIGNDVVVIIYQDGKTKKPFNATSITSKFNHVYIVVQAVNVSEKNSSNNSSSNPTSTNSANSKQRAQRESLASRGKKNPNNKASNAGGNKSNKSNDHEEDDAIEVETAGVSSPTKHQKSSSNNSQQQKIKYKVAVVSKHGVKPHGPVLPEPGHLWDLDDLFRDFLLTKIINAERAAYYAPGFGQARTRRLWLKDLIEKYGPTPKHVNSPSTEG